MNVFAFLLIFVMRANIKQGADVLDMPDIAAGHTIRLHYFDCVFVCERLTNAARQRLALVQPFEPILCGGDMPGRVFRARLSVGAFPLIFSAHALEVFGQGRLVVLVTCPEFYVRLGVLALQLADLVNRDHRNARLNGIKDFDFPGADPIVELIKTGIQLLPEGHAAGDRHGLAFDRTQTRDMLLLYLAAYTAGFHKTDLKP